MKGTEDFRTAKRNRRLHYFMQAALMISLAVGVNFLATRFFLRTDLSISENLPLSAETKKVLEGLTEPIDVIVTITESVDPDQPRLLNRLALDLKTLATALVDESSSKAPVRTHFVNVFKRQGANEEIVAKYELREQNQILVACGDRVENIFNFEDAGSNRRGAIESSGPSANVRILEALDAAGLYDEWEEDSSGRLTPKLFRGEKMLLRAIRKVSRKLTDTRKAYFLVGHGEMELTSWNETRGLSEMKSFLDGLGIETNSFLLGSGQSVPDDADIVIVASPQVPLSEEEAFYLQGYLTERRGSMLLLLDPVQGMENHGLQLLLRPWGLSCHDMRLVEPAVERSYLAPYRTLAYNRKDSHPIVAHLAKHNISLKLFPQASRGRPVLPLRQAPARVTVTNLITTSEASWAEDDWRQRIVNIDPQRRNLALNVAGPVAFAAAAERKVRSKHDINIPGGKLIVFGNSTLFSNIGLEHHGNRSLFANVSHWLLDENEFLDIPPQSIRRYDMELDANEYRSLLYHLALVPGIVALIGFSRRILRRDA